MLRRQTNYRSCCLGVFRQLTASGLRSSGLRFANICSVAPLAMHEDDEIQRLCPTNGALNMNLKMMELEALVMAQSKHLAPPVRRPQTMGDIIDYLLVDERDEAR
jgi:hypothetical protein